MKKKEKFVQVMLDFDDDTLLKLCILAHNADMTLNQYTNKILKEYIKSIQ